ncbi:putative glycerophosphodiester phosphodiesterase [Helianthus annuus]|uniref:Glycerophosphodiester phosphodiesterase n=1 Tax=Helianthus annuus TaxID=4232 RepID=A0A251U8D6_HELAN|nr:putative glycerophosphodiester phosphodiesterase [Helianthus annuus]KAJ0585799.1 putative glycerophosphodiester phosphodiesterase [Helianthus annuus]KAJ0920431.1 putative glycerophosphodiester phosphodiesterase [Helianthus annuus]
MELTFYRFDLRKSKLLPIGVDGLFIDFPGSLHRYQEWTSSPSDKLVADKLSNEMVT